MSQPKRTMLSVWVLLCLLGGLLPAGAAQGVGGAYVEPSLLARGRGDRSVIVTAVDTGAAARAVRRAGGQVDSELWLIDGVAATVPAGRVRALAARPGVQSIVDNKRVETAQDPDWTSWDGWVTDYRFPVPWDGRPDVVETNQWKQPKVVTIVPVDIGADVLYGLYGTEVTVAVVDSGVYFDPTIQKELGRQLSKLFEGQADFVDPTCEMVLDNRGNLVSSGVQGEGYCLTGMAQSKDPYGHGTHVAGIMWNQMDDNMTGAPLGVAREARILSVRVLGEDGSGTYARVIQGIQYVVDNKDALGIRVLNLSLSAQATTPYFVDPLNRAAEAAWAAGIVVVAAAGNEGAQAGTITVPGNDPYVLTVGAVDSLRTAGYWGDDVLPAWTASGPTADGFAKPDVLAPGANIVSFMYNDKDNPANSALLVREHPDYSETASLFRMNGTSMATAVTSGVAALMLQAHPGWTPDQVKYRLMASARPALTAEGDLVYNLFQQGMGRIWPADAIYGDLPDGQANAGMDIQADLAHGWDADGDGVADPDELATHYQGPVRRALSDDGSTYLYYVLDGAGSPLALGMASALDGTWLGEDAWADGMAWAGALSEAGIDPTSMAWAGGMAWAKNIT